MTDERRPSSGVGMQAYQATREDLPDDVAWFFYVFGTVASVLGGIGVGGRLGRQIADENLRRKLAPAFRRATRTYRGLGKLKGVLDDRRQDLSDATKPNGALAAGDVKAALDVLDARLDEQLATFDDALDEWSELVPLEVKRFRQDLEEADSR
jgi:hypothetical protein